MQRILFFVLLLLSSNLAAQEPAESMGQPGQVLSESSTDLGNGYREVSQSQVNPPDHWEGVGHFVFIYFKELRLCQCSAREIALSPNGNYAIFVDEESGRLTLFDAKNNTTRAITEKYAGTPSSTEWDLEHGRAIVELKRWVNEKNDYQRTKIEIVLKSGS